MLAVLATASLALAGSPQLRQQLVALSGVGGSGNRITSLLPAPAFTVLQPTSLPPETQLLVRAYNPNQASSGQTPLPVPMMLAAGAGGRVDAAVAKAATDRAQQLLGNGTTSTLVLIYVTDGDQLLELVEQPGSGRTLPAGTPVVIGHADGVLTRGDTGIVLTWFQQGTWLEIHTGLSQAQALQFAVRLQSSTLTSDGGAPSASQPALPTHVPLAQRVAAVTTPSISDAILAGRCGSWPAEPAGHLGYAGSQQATCVARAVVGAVAGDFPSSGVSLVPWRDAAAQLGLDPARGPSGNPPVLTVELGDNAGVAGWEAVLDKGTGHPYLLVQLKRGQ